MDYKRFIVFQFFETRVSLKSPILTRLSITWSCVPESNEDLSELQASISEFRLFNNYCKQTIDGFSCKNENYDLFCEFENGCDLFYYEGCYCAYIDDIDLSNILIEIIFDEKENISGTDLVLID